MTHACIKLTNGAPSAKPEAGQETKKDLANTAAATTTSTSTTIARTRPATSLRIRSAAPNDDGLEEANYTSDGQPDEKDLDSGYAWLILLVMFLLASSTGGTNRVYGLIYAKQVAIGYYDHEQASWPIATASTVENLAGLMTPALAQILTWRQIELLATIFFVSANVGAYFSDSLLLDILCLGLIQGLALSINTVLSLVINNDYFRRYRTSAYGISLSGSTFGIIYLGPIVSWCLEADEMEFRSGYLAIGAVLALNALLVIFIRPRNKAGSPATPDTDGAPTGAGSRGQRDLAPAPRKMSRLERHLERKSSVASIALMCKQRRQSVLQRQSTMRSPSIVSGLRQLPVGQRTSQAAAADQPAPCLKKSPSSATVADRRHKVGLFSAHEPQQLDWRQDLGADEIGGAQRTAVAGGKDRAPSSLFCSNLVSFSRADSSCRSSVCSYSSSHHEESSIIKRPIDISQPADRPTRTMAAHEPAADMDADTDRAASANTDADAAAETEPNKGGQTKIGPTLDDGDERLSWRLVGALLRSPYLHCVWIMLSLYYLIARIFIIILVDLAKDNGLSMDESRSLLNYWSVGEIVGRILLCSFVDLQWLSCRLCILLTCTSMSLCIGAMVLLSGSFCLYAICSALVAALISLEYVLINVLMIEYLGQQRVTSCYSLGSLISSLALLGRPALIGLFRDHLGSYNGLLLLLSALSLSFGLLFGLLEPLLVRYWPKGRLLHRSQLTTAAEAADANDRR